MNINSVTLEECILKARGWTISVSCPLDRKVSWKNLRLTVADHRVPDPNQPGTPLKPLRELLPTERQLAKKMGLSAISGARTRAEKKAAEVEQRKREPTFL